MAYAFGAVFSFADDASGTTLNLPSVTFSDHDRALIPITYGSASTLGETVTDGTNTYTLVPSNGHVNIGADSQTYSLFECKDCVAGTYTLAFTPGSAVPFRALAAITYSGLDNSAAAVVASQNQAGPGTGSNAVTTGNLTPLTQPGALIAFTVDDNGNASSISFGTSFSDRGTISQWDSIVGVLSRVEDRRLTATTAVAGTFTANGNGGGNFPSFAVFIPEATGGGGSTFPVPHSPSSLPTLVSM